MSKLIWILNALVCAVMVVMAGPLGFLGFMLFAALAFILTAIADGIQGWFDGRR